MNRYKFILSSSIFLALVYSCSGYDDFTGMKFYDGSNSTPEVGPTDEDLANYVGPAYADYYVDVNDWSQRSKWNLANVHDPSVMLADDGFYYMVQTDASYGNTSFGHGSFHCRRSRDLVNWEYMGSTMEAAPAWVKEKLNEYRKQLNLPEIANPQYGYWAPVIRNVGNGLYRMYYSIVVNDLIAEGSPWGERAFIGLMETNTPNDNYSWKDKGMVVCSSSDKGTNWFGEQWEGAYFRYNAIDPTYVVTPEGEHWLIYGSWHSGFAALQLDPTTGLALNELGQPWGDNSTAIASYGKRVATRNSASRWQASEGPEVVYRNGYYYMFMAYDALDVPYNTRVVRSEKVTGPYYGIDGTNVTNGGEAYPVMTHPYKFDNSDGWVGISHCAVFSDGKDNWYYASQGRLPAGVNGNQYSNAIMLGQVRAIKWTKEGWPLVMPERYGAVPQVPVTAAELVGDWENIDLEYSYGKQKTSKALVLGSDGVVTSGIWKGSKWSFDAESQILAIGNISLYVMRECDWESESRKATIVYAGFSENGKKTYWGKKSL